MCDKHIKIKQGFFSKKLNKDRYKVKYAIFLQNKSFIFFFKFPKVQKYDLSIEN